MQVHTDENFFVFLGNDLSGRSIYCAIVKSAIKAVYFNEDYQVRLIVDGTFAKATNLEYFRECRGADECPTTPPCVKYTFEFEDQMEIKHFYRNFGFKK